MSTESRSGSAGTPASANKASIVAAVTRAWRQATRLPTYFALSSAKSPGSASRNSPDQPKTSASITAFPSVPFWMPNSTKYRLVAPMRLKISTRTPSSPFCEKTLCS